MDIHATTAVERGNSPAIPNQSSIVAAQLFEAACRARDGDCETAKAHIAHAVALLQGKPSSMPFGTRTVRMGERHSGRGGLATWQALRLVAHVDANLAGRIRVEELAAVLELSVSHFGRAFKCTFGMSPRDYVAHRRIEFAQGLMLTTCDTLSAIAFSCGASDQSHFTRLFRKVVGETPYSWRRTRRDAIEDQTMERAAHAAQGGPKRPMALRLR